MPKLPTDILKRRVSQEIAMAKRKLSHIIAIDGGEINEFPVTIMVTLINTPGPIWKNDDLDHKKTHQTKLIITDEYPWQKPIVKWQSNIFHPNIKNPEDGGDVCTKLLDSWGFQSNILSFIKGVESLLTNPNGKSPWGTESCTMAAQYFNTHDYDPPNVGERDTSPRIIRKV